MRSLTTLSIAAMLAAGSLTGAMAQTNIYVYNFNDASTLGTNASATPANTAALFSVDENNSAFGGTSSLSTSFTPQDDSAGTSSIVSFTGTVVGAAPSDVAGADLGLLGGGATGAITNNGAFIQAAADLTGYTGITVSYASRGSGTGFKSQQFQYSLDGINFTNFGTAYVPTGTYVAVPTYDLSGVAGLSSDPAAAFRFVFTGATGAGGNNRLDNIIIAGTAAAVPEASTTVSFGLLLALGLGGFAASRRRKVTAN